MSEPNDPPQSEVMTADEAAKFLRLNRNTIYAAVARKTIPHRRVGRRVLFSRTALLHWLDGGIKESRR